MWRYDGTLIFRDKGIPQLYQAEWRPAPASLWKDRSKKKETREPLPRVFQARPACFCFVLCHVQGPSFGRVAHRRLSLFGCQNPSFDRCPSATSRAKQVSVAIGARSHHRQGGIGPRRSWCRAHALLSRPSTARAVRAAPSVCFAVYGSVSVRAVLDAIELRHERAWCARGVRAPGASAARAAGPILRCASLRRRRPVAASSLCSEGAAQSSRWTQRVNRF